MCFCSFQKLLITLLNADRTYLKMAKDMVYGNLVGPILELLDNMLHNQIVSYTRCIYKISMSFYVHVIVGLSCISDMVSARPLISSMSG